MKSIVPDWIPPHYVAGRAQFEFEGEMYEYLLIESAFGLLPYVNVGEVFVAYKPEESMLLISNAYPERWRTIGLIHEIIEKRPSNQTRFLDRCLRALEEELAWVDANLPNESGYLAFRRDFFAGMVAYYSRRSNAEEQLILAGLRASYNRLKILAG